MIVISTNFKKRQRLRAAALFLCLNFYFCNVRFIEVKTSFLIGFLIGLL